MSPYYIYIVYPIYYFKYKFGLGLPFQRQLHRVVSPRALSLFMKVYLIFILCYTTDSSCTIKEIDGETVTKYEEEINGKDVALLNIKNACILLYGNPSVLHAKNIENSVILCGPISGSAFVGNLQNVKLNIACHQLRIHETHDSEFYIHLGSRAIIENCNRVQFAPYAWYYPKLSAHFDQSSLDGAKSNWECVDDFNWLNEAASPNWNFLKESQRLKWTTSDSGELITSELQAE